MIVTRQRKKPFPWRRLILPVVAIGLVIFAFAWPPSRNVITAGPMGPLWSTVGNGYNNVAAPFNYAAELKKETALRQQLVQANQKADTLQKQIDEKDKKITDLNNTVQQLQVKSANAPATNATPSVGASPQGGITGSQASGASDLTQGATPDMRRTASVWANMEPENAAKVIQKLPIPYVARILALMAPDTVGSILDALPAAYAAKLTQDHPELKS